MSISVIWDNEEQTIIRYVMDGPWTWSELYEALGQGHRLLDTVDHTVHCIIDMQKTRLIPNNPLLHGKRMSAGKHPRAGKIVFVDAHAFMQALIGVFRKIYPALLRDILFAETMEEARALLASVETG